MDKNTKNNMRTFARQVATVVSDSEMEKVAGGFDDGMGGTIQLGTPGTCEPFGSQSICFGDCEAFLDAPIGGGF